MQLDVYLPLIFSAVFGLAAPALTPRLPPAAATWLLSVGAVCAAAGSLACLAFLGLTIVGQLPLVAAAGEWSDATLRYNDPVSSPVAACALGVLLVLAVRVARAAGRRVAALREAYRLAAVLPSTGGELAVVDHPELHACAVPGRPGRIVISTRLLRCLDAAQRRALLTHERSHLIHRHHVHHSLAVLASAANPLLIRLPAAVALATERWADEDAAAVCPRATVAEALTRAALGRIAMSPSVVLAAAAADVAARVAALRLPAPRVTVWRVAVLLGLVTAIAVAAVAAGQDTEQLFELAQRAYLIR